MKNPGARGLPEVRSEASAGTQAAKGRDLLAASTGGCPVKAVAEPTGAGGAGPQPQSSRRSASCNVGSKWRKLDSVVRTGLLG